MHVHVAVYVLLALKLP